MFGKIYKIFIALFKYGTHLIKLKLFELSLKRFKQILPMIH